VISPPVRLACSVPQLRVGGRKPQAWLRCRLRMLPAESEWVVPRQSATLEWRCSPAAVSPPAADAWTPPTARLPGGPPLQLPRPCAWPPLWRSPCSSRRAERSSAESLRPRRALSGDGLVTTAGYVSSGRRQFNCTRPCTCYTRRIFLLLSYTRFLLCTVPACSTYLKFGNVRYNLMEKGVFLGVPKNTVFVGMRQIVFWT
jgi:hypothetical protein